MYKNVKRRISRDRADVTCMFFGYRSLLEASGGNMWAETLAEQRRDASNALTIILTMKRYQWQKAVHLTKKQKNLKKRDRRTNRIFTSCTDIQHISFPVIVF